MINVGDILSTVGVFRVLWGDIMSTVGIILSTVGDTQYRGEYHDARGGYHEYCGGVQYHGGKNVLLFEYPTVLNTPMVLMISPQIYYDIPHGTQISKDGIPHGTEHPMCIMIFPTVLSIPHSTQDNPPRY